MADPTQQLEGRADLLRKSLIRNSFLLSKTSSDVANLIYACAGIIFSVGK